MDFEEIRARVKEIPCSRYLHKAKKSGLICPFCESGTGPDGTGAAMYYEKDNRFYCNKCERRGDVIDAYLYDTGRNPDDGKAHREAVIELGQSIGLYLDDKPRRESKTPAKNDLNAPRSDLKGAGDNLPADGIKSPVGESGAPDRVSKPGLFKADCEKWAANIDKTDYLTQEGITPEIQKRFHIGYIPESNEIVFPYNRDYSYYGKRKADKADKQYRKPKADLAGPEPLYNPGALYHGGPCIICEGAIDVLSIVQAGGNACAVCGGGLKGILREIDRRKPEAPLILWFDNDLPNPKTGKSAGQEEQEKLAAALRERNILFIEARYNLDLYGLEEGDPNDLLQNDPEQLEADIKANVARALECQALGPDMGPFLQTIFTDRYRPVATGITGLDTFLHGGLIRQTLVLLSSKPGSGKTILASMILESMARQGVPCLYLNLEMSKEQMLARSISRILYTDFNCKLNSVQILQGYNRTDDEKALIEKAARKYADEIGPNMTYNPLEKSDLDEILSYLEKAAQEALEAGKAAPCVCIDYLHIITSSKREDTGEIIKRAVQALKEYAKKYNTIVIAIDAQSRAANSSKKADMAAGRDTSALEYSGDLILQLKSGDDLDPAKGDPDLITLYVTKSRFTAFDVEKGLHFVKHGGQSYFEQQGDWSNVPLCDRTPFDDDDTDGEETDSDGIAHYNY